VLYQSGYLAMRGYSSRRFLSSPAFEPIPINWRRGKFRLWLLISAAWIMSWVIDLTMYVLQGGFKASDLFVVPILLFGPPLALLVFGVGAGWAFRGFNIEDRSLR
jgi:hypothetical protein